MGSWNHAEDAVPHQRVTERQPDRVKDSDPQRDEPDTSTRKSGSVGARGGQLPRATRPEPPGSRPRATIPWATGTAINLVTGLVAR